MKKLLKSKLFLFLIAPIIIVGVILAVSSSRKEPVETVRIERGTVVEEVVVTGTTKPAESVQLAFEKSGTVRQTYVKVGDDVTKGTTLIRLDSSELHAQLQEAEALVNIETVKLEEARRGIRPEEIAVSETKVTNAERTLRDSEQSLLNTLRDAYTKADDVIRNKVEQLYSDPPPSPPPIGFGLSDPELHYRLTYGKFQIDEMLIEWKKTLDGATANNAVTFITNANANLITIQTFLKDAAFAISTLTPTGSITQTNIDAWGTDISTARTNINTAITNLAAAYEKEEGARSAVLLARDELLLLRAGSTAAQIAEQEYSLAQAQARAGIIRSQLAKAVLVAPITGVVSIQDAKVGEIVGANQKLISIISENDFEIEANVPEIDYGRISTENTVKITFDAFPGEKFIGTVTHLDPAETIVDGVVNFKITISFIANDTRIKSGLTANLSVETKRKENVLVAPQYVLLEKDEGIFVRVRVDENTFDEVPVTVGVRDQEGFIEILTGVSEGDEVLNVGVRRGT